MFGIGKTERKVLLIIGFILVALGVSVSQGLVSLSVVREPLDIKIYHGTASPVRVLYDGEKLVIDLTHLTPTNAVFNGGKVNFAVGVYDWKSRDAGSVVYTGHMYAVRIYSDGSVDVETTDAPYLTAEERGINQPLGWLNGVLVIWKGDLGIGKIVLDFKDHKIIIGNTTIPMLKDFEPKEAGWWGPVNPPVFRGYLHLYGGYILREIREARAQTTVQATQTSTATATSTVTETPKLIHEPVPVTTTVNGETHIIVAQPVETGETSTAPVYGIGMTAIGLLLIAIAIL